MFMYPFRTRDINNLENATYRYLIWPLWLLFCLGITLTLTILLALSSRPQDDPSRSFVMSAGTRQSAGTPPLKAWTRLLAEVLSNWKEDMRQSVFWLNFVSLGLWVMFVAGKFSEILFTALADLTLPQHRSGNLSRTAYSQERTISAGWGR